MESSRKNKFVLIGNHKSGKTHFLSRLKHEPEKPYSETTFLLCPVTEVEIALSARKKKVFIQDTPADTLSSSTNNLRAGQYKDSTAVFVFYDSRNIQSFEDIKMWIDEARKHAPNAEIAVIGTHIDNDDKKIRLEAAKEKCLKLGVTLCFQTDDRLSFTPIFEEVFQVLDLKTKAKLFRNTYSALREGQAGPGLVKTDFLKDHEGLGPGDLLKVAQQHALEKPGSRSAETLKIVEAAMRREDSLLADENVLEGQLFKDAYQAAVRRSVICNATLLKPPERLQDMSTEEIKKIGKENPTSRTGVMSKALQMR